VIVSGAALSEDKIIASAGDIFPRLSLGGGGGNSSRHGDRSRLGGGSLTAHSEGGPLLRRFESLSGEGTLL